MKEKILNKLSTVTFEPWESEAVSLNENSVSSSDSRRVVSSPSPDCSSVRW